MIDHHSTLIDPRPAPAPDLDDGRRFVLTLGCPDAVGVVAEIAGFLASVGGWIVEAGYHSDPATGWFFPRQVVRADSVPFDADELARRFAPLAARIGADGAWSVTDTGREKSVVLLVSKEKHCLHDLLGRIATGELPVRLAAVIGNHAPVAELVRAHGATFHHVAFPPPGTAPQERARAFATVRDLVACHDPDAVVLARLCRSSRPRSAPSGPARCSTSTTASCRRSSVHGPTTRRARGASS